ncbi:hypothetical protein D3C81_720800 [compost metagenome]
MVAEVAVDDFAAFEFDLLASRRPVLDQLQELVRRHAGFHGDGEAFGQRDVVDADHRIMRQLRRSAAAVLAHMQEQPPHGVKYVAVRFNNIGAAADHEDERPVDSAGLAAGNRRIEEMPALRADGGCNFLDESGGDGAGIDDHRSGLERFDQSVRSVEDVTDGIIIAHHCDDNVFAFRRSPGSGGRGRAFSDQRLAFGCRAVVHRYLESRPQQVESHGRPHRSESDKSDLFHEVSHLC